MFTKILFFSMFLYVFILLFEKSVVNHKLQKKCNPLQIYENRFQSRSETMVEPKIQIAPIIPKIVNGSCKTIADSRIATTGSK